MNALSKGERNFIYTPAKYRLDFNIFKNASDKSPSLRVFESDSEDGFNREIETLFNMYFKEHKENRAIKTLDGIKRFLKREDGPRFNFYSNGLFHGLVLEITNHNFNKETHVTLPLIQEICRDYTYVAYTSFDHMIDGIERFHLVLPFRNGVKLEQYREMRHHLLNEYESLSLNTRSDVGHPLKTWLLPQCPVSALKCQPTFSRNYGILISDGLPIAEKVIPRNPSTVFQDNNSIYANKVKQNFNFDYELIFNLELNYLLSYSKSDLFKRFVKVLSCPSIAYHRISERERYEILQDLRFSGAPFDLFYSWCKESAVDNDVIVAWLEKWRNLHEKNSNKLLTIFEIAKKYEVLDYNGVGKGEFDGELYFADRLYDNAPRPIKIIANYIMAKSIRKHKASALSGAISLLGYFYHRRIIIYDEQTGEGTCTNFYNALIAPSGFGKGAVTSVVKDLCLDLLDHRSYPLYNAPVSGGGFFKTIKRRKGSLFFILDEFAGQLLHKITGQNLSSFLSLLVAELTNIYSVANKKHLFSNITQDDKKDREFVIEKPHVSVFGTATTRDFLKYYQTNLGYNGFLGRFLVFFPDPRTMISNYHSSEVFLNNREEVIELLRGILKLKVVDTMDESPKEVMFASPEVARYFSSKVNFYQDRANIHLYNQEDVQVSIYNRIAEKALKIALLSNENGVISLETLKWGFDVAECSALNIINQLFGHSSLPQSEFQREAEALYNFILKNNRENHGPISLSVITSGYRRLDSEKIRRFLKELKVQGRIKMDEVIGEKGHKKIEILAI